MKIVEDLRIDLNAGVRKEAELFRSIFRNLRNWPVFPATKKEFLEKLCIERDGGIGHSAKVEPSLDGNYVKYITSNGTELIIWFSGTDGRWSSTTIIIPAERIGGRWHTEISELARVIEGKENWWQWLAPRPLWWAWDPIAGCWIAALRKSAHMGFFWGCDRDSLSKTISRNRAEDRKNLRKYTRSEPIYKVARDGKPSDDEARPYQDFWIEGRQEPDKFWWEPK